jgi:SAM-dependent methyltransferase
MTDFEDIRPSAAELATAREISGPFGIPLPPRELRAATGPTEVGDFLRIGEVWAQNCYPFLPPDPAVLDVGCGCGKMARFLVAHPTLRYVGIDVLEPSIAWARDAFAHYADRFTFQHIDVFSDLYNKRGTIPPGNFQFPFEVGTFDLAICGSLFTHLLKGELHRYLSQICRCLKPEGRMIASIHVEPATGTEFSGNSARIDMTEAFWLRTCKQHGLALHEPLGGLYGQMTYVMAKTAAARAALGGSTG